MKNGPEFQRWLEVRPDEIRLAATNYPPWLLYRLKTTGHTVFIMSYVESNAEPMKCAFCENGGLPGHSHIDMRKPEVTVTVGVTRQYNPNISPERRVFGIRLDDLEPLPNQEE